MTLVPRRYAVLAHSDPPSLIDGLFGLLCNLDTADTVLPAIYTPQHTRDAADDRRLLTALTTAAQHAGFHVPDAVLIAADGWTGTATPRQPAPLQPPTIALPPLLDTRQAAHLPHPDPVAGAALDLHRPDAARTAITAWEGTDPTDHIETACTQPHADALLAIAASLPPLRDVVLLQASWGQPFARHAWRQNLLHHPLTDHSPTARAYRGDWTRPDPTRLHTLAAALHATAAAAASEERAAIAAMLAWINWALGRSTIAAHLAATATAGDPEIGLAHLISDLVATGHLPAWAFNPTPTHPYDPTT